MTPVLVSLITLLLLPLVLPGQPQLIRSVPGTVDEDGICHYMVHLLNSSTTLKQLKQLQSTAQELMSKYEQELSRVSEYARAIEDQDSQVLEINDSPNSRDPTALASSYESPVFNLLRLELEGAQELVAQLKAKERVSGAGDFLYQLQSQVANASLTLKLLADSDQCSFHCLRQEVDVLKGQLSECEREKEQEEASTHRHPPLPLGSCAHGGLQKVSRPIVVQLNWRGFSYKAGTWGRDSAPNPASFLYWVAPLREDGSYFDYYQLHKSYDGLVLLKNYKQWKMGYGDGSGNIVYKNSMYFNYYGTGEMAKVDLSSNSLVLRCLLPDATYNNCFSYAGVPWKDLDFAGDEKRLWVLYATDESKGNLMVSRLNASTLEVEKTWTTSQYKPSLSGAFVACGVLYALCSLSTRQEEIFYAFDTTTGQKCHLSILLDKMLETLQGINYWPSDHKLYVYNDSYLINYDFSFLTLKCRLPRPPSKRPSGAQAPPKADKPNKPSRPGDPRAKHQ